jgi:hypothetical protein
LRELAADDDHQRYYTLMQTVFNIALSILFLFVAGWVIVFGGIGSLLSTSRGGTKLVGFLWGTLAGPIGWLAILWTTRGGHRLPAGGAPWSGTGEAPVPRSMPAPPGPAPVDADSGEGRRL